MYCFKPGIHPVVFHRVVFRVVLLQAYLHRAILHPVILHRVVFHQVFLCFDDAGLFVIGFGAILDYFPDRTYF
jgi:hypothetical protein